MSTNSTRKDTSEAATDSNATESAPRKVFLAIDDGEDSKPVKITPLPKVLTPSGDDGA